MKHFTLESASLHSIPGRNVVNSQTFYFSILSTFRGPLSRDIPALELCIPFTAFFIAFIHTLAFFTHHTLHLLCIYIARAEYFLIPDDAVDRQKKKKTKQNNKKNNSRLRPYQNSYIFFNHDTEGQHEQIIAERKFSNYYVKNKRLHIQLFCRFNHFCLSLTKK